MRRGGIERDGKSVRDGNRRVRRVESVGRGWFEHGRGETKRGEGAREGRQRERDSRGHGATRHCTCTCIDTDIYARQLIMSKSFDLSLAFMEGN